MRPPKQMRPQLRHRDGAIVEGILELSVGRDRAAARAVELAGILHVQRLVRALLVVALDEAIELRLLLQEVLRGGLVASFFSVRCMRSWRPFCCGLPGLMRSIAIPKRNHHTDSLLRPKNALVLAKGTPLSVRIAQRQAEVLESPLKHA